MQNQDLFTKSERTGGPRRLHGDDAGRVKGDAGYALIMTGLLIIPLMIFTDIRSFVPSEHVRAWTAAFVLLAMILILFVLARLSARAQNGLPMLRPRHRKGSP